MLTGLASPVGQGALELNVTLQAPYQRSNPINTLHNDNRNSISIFQFRAGAGGEADASRWPVR